MGGTLLVIAGVWVLCQVFGGDALGRLGVTGTGTSSSGTSGKATGKVNPATAGAVGGASSGVPFPSGMGG